MSFDTSKRNAENDSLAMETYPILDPGIYRAKLESIQSKDMQFGETLIFTWRVIGGDSDGETFDGLATKKLMPRSKLAGWAKAHLGLNVFPENFVLTLSSLIGKEVHVTLAVEPRKDGGGDVNVVQAVSPYKASTKKAKTPAPAAAQPAADNGFTDAFDDIPDPGEPMRANERRVEA
jgi:hypothetical protein